MSVVDVERIDVGERTIEARVFVSEPRFLRTTGRPGLAEQALGALPGLARHTCRSDSPRGMVAELADTETPHLLEHLAVELMALAGSPRSLYGSTSWDFARDGARRFRVTLEYDDDLVALGALKLAGEVVDWLFGEGERPDVAAGVERLRGLRGRAAER